MNNSYNYADFIGMSLTSNEEFEPYGYQQELQQLTPHSQESNIESGIEHMLFGQHKYHNYYE